MGDRGRTDDEHHPPNSVWVTVGVLRISCALEAFDYISRTVECRMRTGKGVLEMVKGLGGRLRPPGTMLAHSE
jgi:hypothetical protein